MAVLFHLRALRDHDETVLGDVKPSPVRLEIETNLRPLRDLDVLVDDAAAEARVAADAHALEEDALFDLAEGVDTTTDRQHGPMNAPAGDDAAVAHQRVRRDPPRARGPRRRNTNFAGGSLVTPVRMGQRVLYKLKCGWISMRSICACQYASSVPMSRQ